MLRVDPAGLHKFDWETNQEVLAVEKLGDVASKSTFGWRHKCTTQKKGNLMSDLLLLTIAETAALLHVSLDTVRRSIRAGVIPCKRLRSNVRISRSWLDTFVAETAAGVAHAAPGCRQAGREHLRGRCTAPSRTAAHGQDCR